MSDPQPRPAWDAAAYDEKHAFVWQLAADLLELVAPRAGERILDLGCGTGHLTRRIADAGAEVVGLDVDTGMIEQARRHYPGLRFDRGDAADFSVAEPNDAVFSNAALHWVRDAEAAVRCIAGAGDEREAFLRGVEARLRPEAFRDGRWIVDYRRIRVVAVRVA